MVEQTPKNTESFASHELQRMFETNILDRVHGYAYGLEFGEIDQAAFLNECRLHLELADFPSALSQVTLLTFAKGIGTKFLANDPLIVDVDSLVQAYRDKRGDNGMHGENAIGTAVDVLNVIKSSHPDDVVTLYRAQAQIEGVYHAMVRFQGGAYVVG